MVANSELRANARKQLGGGIFSNGWLLMMLVCLICSAALGIASAISIVLIGAVSYALCRTSVSMVRGRTQPDFNDLLKGFTEDFGNVCLLGILREIFIFLWSLLLIIPGIIKSYAYSMSSYIQQDSANKNWKDCLDESQRIMKGYKWKLFCLDLSFIGWYILGILCFGIGVLFVAPYHEVARANFYEALCAENAGMVKEVAAENNASENNN